MKIPVKTNLDLSHVNQYLGGMVAFYLMEQRFFRANYDNVLAESRAIEDTMSKFSGIRLENGEMVLIEDET
jgi:hypothetical protein